jgi:hypothetical protein
VPHILTIKENSHVQSLRNSIGRESRFSCHLLSLPTISSTVRTEKYTSLLLPPLPQSINNAVSAYDKRLKCNSFKLPVITKMIF